MNITNMDEERKKAEPAYGGPQQTDWSSTPSIWYS